MSAVREGFFSEEAETAERRAQNLIDAHRPGAAAVQALLGISNRLAELNNTLRDVHGH